MLRAVEARLHRKQRMRHTSTTSEVRQANLVVPVAGCSVNITAPTPTSPSPSPLMRIKYLPYVARGSRHKNASRSIENEGLWMEVRRRLHSAACVGPTVALRFPCGALSVFYCFARA